MKNSRLHQVLESFSPKDVREFSKFVRSPWFNQRDDLILCWDFLEERLFRLDLVPVKEEIFREVYPGRAYDAQQARLLMSWLLKLIEQYFACEDLMEDATQVKLSLLKTYRKRRLPTHFHYTLRDLTALQEKESLRNADHFETNYMLMLEEYRHTASEQRIGRQNLQEISDNLDLAFISRKLRQACLALSHQAVYKIEYHFGLLKQTLAYVEEEELLHIPAIAVYYHCFKALSGQGLEDHFHTFKSLIFTQGRLFPEEELRDLYLLAINYCIKRLNDGEGSFAEEGLELYKKGLETGILLVNRQLSRFTYRNIVAMGLKVGDFDWVASFIRQYRSSLKKEHQESMFRFSMARLEYQRKNYDQALPLLLQAGYEDLLLLLAAKTLQLKIYYETDEWDPLHSHLEAMKHFIHRKKIMGYHKINYLNLIHYTRKLIAVNPYDKKQVEELKELVQKEEILTEKEWLMEQLMRL
jgi:hypothetical protein